MSDIDAPRDDGGDTTGTAPGAPGAEQQARSAGSGAGATRRIPAFSYFFPAHDEEANIEGLVGEALETLPALADRFEIIAVDDGSGDATPEIADRLEAAHPGVIRVVHHATNLGYGAALRSGFAASRYPVVGFTDGDRQFRVADLGRLLAVLDPAGRERATDGEHAAGEPRGQHATHGPDAVVGYRIERADAPIRLLYARLYRLALRTFFGLGVRDVDCACKVFRREALEGVRLESGGAFLSAELLIKFQVRGGHLAEVGVPHYPRTAGRATGARPSVVLRAVRDFWMLRLRLWANRRAALRRGRPVVD